MKAGETLSEALSGNKMGDFGAEVTVRQTSWSLESVLAHFATALTVETSETGDGARNWTRSTRSGRRRIRSDDPEPWDEPPMRHGRREKQWIREFECRKRCTRHQEEDKILQHGRQRKNDDNDSYYSRKSKIKGKVN